MERTGIEPVTPACKAVPPALTSDGDQPEHSQLRGFARLARPNAASLREASSARLASIRVARNPTGDGLAN
jgi:hypothetical protein